jgi:hypothetical protein
MPAGLVLWGSSEAQTACEVNDRMQQKVIVARPRPVPGEGVRSEADPCAADRFAVSLGVMSARRMECSLF